MREKNFHRVILDGGKGGETSLIYVNAILPGLKFKCLPFCGICCKYKVALLDSDIEKIEKLGYKREKFCQGNVLIKKEDGNCIFLSPDKKCKIYPYRPFYCRAFPIIRDMYPELELTADLSCPGVDRGEEIKDSDLNKLLEEEDKLASLKEKYLSQKKTVDTIESILKVRGQCIPREKMREEGIKYLNGIIQNLPLTEGGRKLLNDYFKIWISRQCLFRFADSMALSSIEPIERSKFYLGFLREIGENFLNLKKGNRVIDESLVWGVIRNYDAYFRTRCTSSTVRIN